MAQLTDDTYKKLVPRHRSPTAFRWTIGRRRRRLPTVRLGGKKGGGGSFLARVKLRWVRAKYMCMLKKLKKYYDSVVKEMHMTAVEEGEEESFRRRAQRHYEAGYFASAPPPVGWV